jgi:hypothetical protein
MPHDEDEYFGADDWMADLRAQQYVNQIELSTNGYDERLILCTRESPARTSMQQVPSSDAGDDGV